MIIRAVNSSSEEEASDGDTAALHFATGPASHDQLIDNSIRISTPTAVKLAWLSVSLALVALLLLDLAALLNQIFPGAGTGTAAAALEPPRADPFSALSWLLLTWWKDRAVSPSSAPATTLNNLLGQLFVCAWIYNRESSLRAQRRRHHQQRSRPRNTNRSIIGRLSAALTSSVPYSIIVGVLCLGHLASCLYILFALLESHGDAIRTKFWLGRFHNGSNRTAPRV